MNINSIPVAEKKKKMPIYLSKLYMAQDDGNDLRWWSKMAQDDGKMWVKFRYGYFSFI